ncbi:MAG TPA: FtsX-like permease family protein [Gemmatimonadales bacterium]|nr:FtsX-like permease family protein [Gemmatimonadales bacterium]
MTAIGFVLRMARREARAEAKRLTILLGAIAIGVAALVGINSFTENLQDSVRDQARALLGADLAMSSRRALSPRVTALVDTLGCGGGSASGAACGRIAYVTEFPAMGFVPRTAGTRLVNVSAVAGAYPFYGVMLTRPRAAWVELQRGRHAIVEPALLTALNARLGDTLSLGEARFTISGTVENLPGEVGLRSAFGPRVFIPARYLEETKLLGFGARAERQAFIKLRSPADADALAKRYRPELRTERVRIRTVADDEEDLNDVLSRLGRYLGLVALIALLLGGIGVGSAVVVFVRRKLDTIAVLRCIGATAGQVFAIYLLQAAVLGLAGSVLGATVGVAVQQLLPRLLEGMLPVDVNAAIAPGAIALGIAMGLWTALIFAVLPLLGVRRVTPLAALRRAYEPAPASRDPWRWPATGALAASIVLLAAVEVGGFRTAAIFSAAIGAVLGVLWLAAWLLVRGVRRWFPARWPYVWRQGLANLFRPANQTVAVVLALGFGAFLLGTLFLVQHNLLRGLSTTGGPQRPNLLLLDVQSDQAPGVAAWLAQRKLPEVGPVPIVPMRIASVKGRRVNQLLGDSVAGGEPRNAWAYRREYRSTYRDTLVASEQLVSGRWWSGSGASACPPGGEPACISVEQDLARELGVAVGDEIVWDVQGVEVPARVTSLRMVEWARFEPNFFVVFAPGTLEKAPQTLITLTRVEDAALRGRLQRELAERWSNVTTLDLSLVQREIERIVGRVTLAIRFMALFSLATGALVMIGAIATSRFQRVREAVLLRTLGATRQQVLRIAFVEYLTLGLLASFTAVALATAAGWGIARFFFDDARYWIPLPQLLALVALIVALTVLVGLWSTRGVLHQPPLEVLRQE